MNYKFNKSVLNTNNFTLSINGLQKSVEPKVFDLILYLIRHRNQVVTRQQLFDDLWDGRLVSDTTLSNHIKMARAALEDDGEQQAVIKTVRSRGYQFVAKVEELSSTIEESYNLEDFNESRSYSGSHLKKNPIKIMIGVLVIMSIFIIIFLKLSYSSVSKNKVSSEDNIRPYILVVPFDVSGNEPNKWEPFADQMTREVIRNLRKISGLQVIPASSAFSFKENKTQSYINQQLPKVRYVLDAVISVGIKGKIRITTQLDDMHSGKLVWDADYQSRIDDSNFFAVQSNIAASVSDSLKIVIDEDERQILGEVPTTNLEAYELYVEGKHQFEIVTYESLYRSIELFSKTIALDPNFEAAYIAKADSYRKLMSYFEKPSEILPEVIASVVEALAINPDSAEARSSLGLAYAFAWRWEDAWKMLNEARQVNPDLALTELGFALYYSGLGDIEGVHRSLARATQIDPLNVEIADWGHWALAMVGETKAAIEWSENQIRLHPKVGIIYSGASVSAAMSGDFDRAIALAAKGVELDPDSSFPLLALAQSYGYAGQMDKVRPLLNQAELFSSYTCPYESAIVYLQLGEMDKTFELLNDAIDFRSNCLVFIRYDKRLAPLRDDLRFSSILTRVGLDYESMSKYSR